MTSKEYLRRNLIHAQACGVEAGLQKAVNKLLQLKNKPKWLMKLLRETLNKTEGIRQELANHRDEE